MPTQLSQLNLHSLSAEAPPYPLHSQLLLPDGDPRPESPGPLTHFAVGKDRYFNIVAQSVSAPHRLDAYSGFVRSPPISFSIQR